MAPLGPTNKHNGAVTISKVQFFSVINIQMEKKHSCQHNDNLQKRENTLKQILYFVHVQVCNVNKLVSVYFCLRLFWSWSVLTFGAWGQKIWRKRNRNWWIIVKNHLIEVVVFRLSNWIGVCSFFSISEGLARESQVYKRAWRFYTRNGGVVAFLRRVSICRRRG